VIHVRRSRVKAPPSLRGGGRTEREQVIAFYAGDANRGKAFKYSAYKKPDVIAKLNELFHEKCAYCESHFRATAPVDVEHFRPKGAIVIDGARAKPGYYWLAARWDNLLPSCIDCNRARTQRFDDDDDEDISEVSGKENKFPLIDEAKRARRPEGEPSERGQRLLLHPCRDRPETHLEFLPSGLIRARPSSRKGATSIAVYGLRRKGLKEERRATLLRLAEKMDTILFFAERLDADPDSGSLDQLKRERERLERARSADQQYAGMARQFIDAFDDALRTGTARRFVHDLLTELTSAPR
jgi:uncharacterized protein (TIGR02646 family)